VCLLNEYWQNSFCSGLACASDGDIVGPEKGRLPEAKRTSHHGRLACVSASDLPCSSLVIASQHACRMPGDAVVAVASQCY
jgi:hypothetical protein